jgi:large subunit ribosomal protein L31
LKKGIHPTYVPAKVTCACGNTFETRSTIPEIRVEICSACHPFFTGRQKIVDTEGRVEKFIQKYRKVKEQAEEKPAEQGK